MQFHLFRLKFRRRFRAQRRQVERLSLEAEERIEERFFKRLNRLTQVRRFIAIWVVFLLFLFAGVMVQIQALGGYFQKLQYVDGGIYNEGVVGNFTTSNPIYATSTADMAVSRLIFAGLLKYGPDGQLVNDLADNWATNDRGNEYTFKLRSNLVWQDGQPVTADDVIFTFNLIKNPDAQSPLSSSWQNVVVQKVDDLSVKFVLPGALRSFPYSLTTGIIPEHILSAVDPSNMRSAEFNTTKPVGAGPFALQALEVSGNTVATRKEQIAMKPNADYYGGKPHIDQFVIHVYRDQDRMIEDYNSKELTAAAGMLSIPDKIAKDSKNDVERYLMSAANMIFFKTSEGLLSDKAVRQALVLASDPRSIIGQIGYSTPEVNEPLLAGQLGYDANYAQTTNNASKASELLGQVGWELRGDGLRYKNGQTLSFTLRAQDTPEDKIITDSLKDQWRKVGVDLVVDLQTVSEMQDTLSFHNYDALLYGITIGTDPDVFAYWHSSQADVRSANRLNFSEYKSSVADASLEAGRNRIDPAVRTAKYQPFLQAWRDDAPALGLYQPRLFYISHVKVDGMVVNSLANPADRYANANQWMIRQARVTTN